MNTFPKYMMATTAIHKLGDISRETPDLCIISSEEGDDYIGNWVTGFGFAHVKFPKSSTRDLTEAEVEKYHGTPLVIGSNVVSFINTKNETSDQKVKVVRAEDGMTTTGTLQFSPKKGSVLYVVASDGHNLRTSTIQSISGNVVKTRNSTYTIEYLKA